jgi:hypothetical protein
MSIYYLEDPRGVAIGQFGSIEEFLNSTVQYFITYNMKNREEENGHCLRDNNGRLIPATWLSKAKRELNSDNGDYYSNGRYSEPFEFRFEAVPGTGHTNRRGRYWRYPKTLNELRETSALKADLREEPYRISGKMTRNKKYLPDVYWDLRRSDSKIKNWKHQRKTKFKLKDLDNDDDV